MPKALVFTRHGDTVTVRRPDQKAARVPLSVATTLWLQQARPAATNPFVVLSYAFAVPGAGGACVCLSPDDTADPLWPEWNDQPVPGWTRVELGRWLSLSPSADDGEAVVRAATKQREHKVAQLVSQPLRYPLFATRTYSRGAMIWCATVPMTASPNPLTITPHPDGFHGNKTKAV